MLQLKPLKPYVAQQIACLRDGLKSSVFKRFAIALLFSVLLHGLLVHQVLLAAFKQAAENAALLNGNTVLIQAALVNPKPEPKAAEPKPIPVPMPAITPQPAPVEPEVDTANEVVSEVADANVNENANLNTSDATNAEAETSLALAGEENQIKQDIQNNQPPEGILPALPEPQELLIGEPHFNKVFRSIETSFDVRTDINASPTQSGVGRASIVFKLDDDGIHYQIDSLIEPKGFAALFISNLTQTSRGLVSTQGLQPQQYDYQFGNKADKTYRAAFDWENRQLTLQTSKGVKQVPLKIGAQDLLSFMYQFMYVTPVGDLQVTMTNGKQLTAYEYRFAGQEVVQTKMGDLNTIHLARVKASQADKSDEKTEVWLALDYQYTPVKIRKIEKSGKMYELLATRIKTEAAN